MSGIYADPNTRFIGIGTAFPVDRLTVDGNIVPSSNLVFDLGSSLLRWRDLYLSGSTIDLGGTVIKRDAAGGGGLKVLGESGQDVDTTVRNLQASGYVNIAGTKLERHVTGPIMVKTAAGEMESGMFKHVYVDGTVRASNLEVLGDYVTLNTITSNTEQMVIENNGTGPGLKVTQTGMQPIADFYDDGGVLAMRIADGGNVGIGTLVPRFNLDVSGNINFTGTLTSNQQPYLGIGDSIPVGTILPYYSSTLTDASYLICDGATYSRASYTELANALGVNPSATTFTVPDLRGKFLKGRSAADAVGATGGSATSTLVEANMPAHSHSGTTVGAGSHRHDLDVIDVRYGGNYSYQYLSGWTHGDIKEATYTGTKPRTLTEPNHTHTFTTDSKGSGESFSILPPYNVVIYVIKAKNNQYVTPVRDGDYWTNVNNTVFYQSGNVGIGTTAPRQLLEVNGNAVVGGNVGVGTAAPTAALHVRPNSTTTGVIIDQVGTGSIIDVRDGGVSKVVVDGNGNMGIGTTNPKSKIEIFGSGDTLILRNTTNAYQGGSSSIVFKNNHTTDQYPLAQIQAIDSQTVGNGTFKGDLIFSTGLNTTLTERMRITSEGNVGIGKKNWIVEFG